MKLEINEQTYCLEAIQKAAYRFIDRLTIFITKSEGNFVCEITPIASDDVMFNEHIANFKRELLDQQLRKQIKDETEPTRNLILAYAFSRSGLQE